MHFLLDANAVIDFINYPDGAVAKAVTRHRGEEVATSSIVLHELYFGAYRSERPARNSAVLETLYFRVVDFNDEDAREAGRVRAWLIRQGTPIGPYDTLIAGQALRRELVVVTANLREFSRVPGLVCEDWSR